MLSWMVFVVTPIIFIFVALLLFRGGQAAMRFMMFVAVVGLVFGGINHFKKSDQEAAQEAELLLGKWAEAMLTTETEAIVSEFNMEQLDFEYLKIQKLVANLPESRRFPELRRIVLEGMGIAKNGIEIARSAQTIKESLDDGRLTQDAAERRMKTVAKEIADATQEARDNFSKMCAYIKRPEKPLEKIEGKDLPQWCKG
jgi:hypothetical protein